MVAVGVEADPHLTARESGWMAGFVALIVLLLAAAASFNGYYDKWEFRERVGSERFSVDRMLDSTAERPFVYRQMNGWLTNQIVDAVPETIKSGLQNAAVGDGRSTIGPDKVASASSDWFWRYTTLYWLTFAEWLAALIVLYRLSQHFAAPPAALSATVVFALLFPVLLTEGGYYYDFPELRFFAAATLCAVRGWLIPLAVIALVAATNKETMVFFLPTLIPFVAVRLGWPRAIAACGAMTVGAAAIYLLIRHAFAGNAGGAFELHLVNNLLFYINPLHLFKAEETYGLPLFRGYSLVILLFIGLIAYAGWRGAPTVLRQHLGLAVLINAPLFFALAYQGEMRNLSLTFVGWTLLLSIAMQRWSAEARTAPPAEARA